MPPCQEHGERILDLYPRYGCSPSEILLLLVVQCPKLLDLHLDLANFYTRPLDGSWAVPLTTPTIDVLRHVLYAALFFVDLIVQPALLLLGAGVIN